jgi:hypothetical protein
MDWQADVIESRRKRQCGQGGRLEKRLLLFHLFMFGLQASNGSSTAY